MTGTSDVDFKYFLQRVLDRYAETEGLSKDNLVPNFGNLQSTVVDDELINKFFQGLRFNTERATAVWKKFMDKHASDVFASREGYLKIVLHMLFYMNKIDNAYDRFTCCLSTVAWMAGAGHRSGQGQFIYLTAAIMMCFFKKKLKASFKGKWEELRKYIFSEEDFRFFHTESKDDESRELCEKVEARAKDVPNYDELQTITFDELEKEKFKLLSYDHIIKCYNEEIRPYLKSGPEIGRRGEKTPAELDTSLTALSLTGELERAESRELSTASAAASRAIQEGADLSAKSRREAEENKAKENLISAITETAEAFLSQCPAGVMTHNSAEAAEACRTELAAALEEFRRNQVRLQGAYQKAESVGVSRPYASQLKKRIQNTRDEVRKYKAAVMSAAASKVYGPLQTVPQEKPEVPTNKVLHCKGGPDPWLLVQGATFRTGEFLQDQITSAVNVVQDRHIGCDHRRKHPVPIELLPSKFAGYSQEVREKLQQAEQDRRLLLWTRSMIYDSRCDVDKLAGIIAQYREEYC